MTGTWNVDGVMTTDVLLAARVPGVVDVVDDDLTYDFDDVDPAPSTSVAG